MREPPGFGTSYNDESETSKEWNFIAILSPLVLILESSGESYNISLPPPPSFFSYSAISCTLHIFFISLFLYFSQLIQLDVPNYLTALTGFILHLYLTRNTL